MTQEIVKEKIKNVDEGKVNENESEAEDEIKEDEKVNQHF